MEAPTFEETLAHYGIPGMKWGVRRSKKQLAKAAKKEAKKQAKTPSEDAVKAKQAIKKVKKGGLDVLTNDELKELNTRLNLEQNYSKMTAKQKSAGQEAAKQILLAIGKHEVEKLNASRGFGPGSQKDKK